MTHWEFLRNASECISKRKKKNLWRVSQLWSAYLENDISELDVSMMLLLLKVAKVEKKYDNNFIDIIEYAALGAERSMQYIQPKE